MSEEQAAKFLMGLANLIEKTLVQAWYESMTEEQQDRVDQLSRAIVSLVDANERIVALSALGLAFSTGIQATLECECGHSHEDILSKPGLEKRHLEVLRGGKD